VETVETVETLEGSLWETLVDMTIAQGRILEIVGDNQESEDNILENEAQI
jgi:hypothetical protein